MRQSNQPAEQNDNNKNNDGRFLLKAGGLSEDQAAA